MLWLIFAGLTLIALGLVAWPLLRARHAAVADRVSYDLAVYRDQLTEVDRDLARGLLTDAQAEAARVEIQRRMLAAGAKAEGKAERGSNTLSRVAAGLLIAGLPAAAFAIYVSLGSPGLPDQPFAQRVAARAGIKPEDVAKLQEMTDTLAAKMAEAPDAAGYAALANGYKVQGRYEEAMKAYGRAIQMGKTDADTFAALGELIVTKNQGAVGPEARQAFLSALKADPADPRSRFYLGLSKAQIGKLDDAIAIWRDLEQDSPADAPWLPTVRSQIAQAAQDLGRDPATIAPKRPDDAPAGSGKMAGPSPAEAENQDQMIRGMVAGLAAKLEQNPADIAGWLRLARSYQVLGEPDKARQSYERASAQAPADMDVKLAFASFLIDQAPAEGQIPPKAAALLREVNQARPDNPDALYFLGLAAAQDGRKEDARGYWQKLLAQIPEAEPSRTQLQHMIDGLDKK